MTENGAPIVKDPVTPQHKSFVLTQARIRLWLMAAAALALIVWLLVEL